MKRALAKGRSLYPIYLPMNAQYQLLQELQSLLEKACFQFSETNLEDVLQKRQWECPEAIELNVWAGVLKTKAGIFASEDWERLGKPWTELLSSIVQIRHTCVHRLRVTAARIKQFLTDAVSFTMLLKSGESQNAVRRLRQEYEAIVEEVGRNKDLLEARLAEETKDIAR